MNSDPRTATWHKILLGVIIRGNAYVTGSNDLGTLDGPPHDPEPLLYGFPVGPSDLAKGPIELATWSVSPFFDLDGELKPSLLFRLTGFTGDPDDDKNIRGEYHRFAAEAKPVRHKNLRFDECEVWVPKVMQRANNGLAAVVTSDIGAGSTRPMSRVEEISKLSDIQLRDSAEINFNSNDYIEAVRYFGQLELRESHKYNDVARYKHGRAYRMLARDAIEQNKKLEYLNLAIKHLAGAAKHRDFMYRAKAIYQLSKAHFDLFNVNANPADLRRAFEFAQEAARLFDDPNYPNWTEYLADLLIAPTTPVHA
jgi:hypothetical protein